MYKNNFFKENSDRLDNLDKSKVRFHGSDDDKILFFQIVAENKQTNIDKFNDMFFRYFAQTIPDTNNEYTTDLVLRSLNISEQDILISLSNSSLYEVNDIQSFDNAIFTNRNGYIVVAESENNLDYASNFLKQVQQSNKLNPMVVFILTENLSCTDKFKLLKKECGTFPLNIIIHSLEVNDVNASFVNNVISELTYACLPIERKISTKSSRNI